MKREAMDHPKMLMLQDRLGLPRYAVVGILESLWHFTSKYAPVGDIGKYQDSLIARSIEWDGDGEQLVRALVESGWIDEHPTFRLVIHDWADHADEATKKKLSREGKSFVDGTVRQPAANKNDRNHDTKDSLSRQRRDSVETPSRPPEPEPEPEPEPSLLVFGASEESSEPNEPPFLEFPIKASSGKKIFSLTHAKLGEYVQTFGNREAVERELRKALQWLRDNPSKQKTSAGMPKFLGSWLSRANDSGHMATSNGSRPHSGGTNGTGPKSQADERLWIQELATAYSGNADAIPQEWLAAFRNLQARGAPHLDAAARRFVTLPRVMARAMDRPADVTPEIVKVFLKPHGNGDWWPGENPNGENGAEQ